MLPVQGLESGTWSTRLGSVFPAELSGLSIGAADGIAMDFRSKGLPYDQRASVWRRPAEVPSVVPHGAPPPDPAVGNDKAENPDGRQAERINVIGNRPLFDDWLEDDETFVPPGQHGNPRGFGMSYRDYQNLMTQTMGDVYPIEKRDGDLSNRNDWFARWKLYSEVCFRTVPQDLKVWVFLKFLPDNYRQVILTRVQASHWDYHMVVEFIQKEVQECLPEKDRLRR
jgi:hypothetical protein